MKMAKAIRQQAATAERVAVNTADTYVAGQMRALAQAFRNPGRDHQEEQEKEEEMSFSIKAMCQHGDLVHRRKTAEAALKKARQMSRAGCYDIYITTPEGRDYHSSEFADLPCTPTVARAHPKTRPPDKPISVSRTPR